MHPMGRLFNKLVACRGNYAASSDSRFGEMPAANYFLIRFMARSVSTTDLSLRTLDLLIEKNEAGGRATIRQPQHADTQEVSTMRSQSIIESRALRDYDLWKTCAPEPDCPDEEYCEHDCACERCASGHTGLCREPVSHPVWREVEPDEHYHGRRRSFYERVDCDEHRFCPDCARSRRQVRKAIRRYNRKMARVRELMLVWSLRQIDRKLNG